MHIVTFIFALVIFFIAVIVSINGFSRISRKDAKGRSTLITGFGLCLLGVAVSAFIFGVFSL
jgi:hypothetical protein